MLGSKPRKLLARHISGNSSAMSLGLFRSTISRKLPCPRTHGTIICLPLPRFLATCLVKECSCSCVNMLSLSRLDASEGRDHALNCRNVNEYPLEHHSSIIGGHCFRTCFYTLCMVPGLVDLRQGPIQEQRSPHVCVVGAHTQFAFCLLLVLGLHPSCNMIPSSACSLLSNMCVQMRTAQRSIHPHSSAN